MNERKCDSCEKNFPYKSGGGYKLNECATCISKRRRHEHKKKAITIKGGKCQICGYDRCSRALNFHHTDPTIKAKTLGNGLNGSWENIKKELDKCVLVCSNCHMELHAGLIILNE